MDTHAHMCIHTACILTRMHVADTCRAGDDEFLHFDFNPLAAGPQLAGQAASVEGQAASTAAPCHTDTAAQGIRGKVRCTPSSTNSSVLLGWKVC